MIEINYTSIFFLLWFCLPCCLALLKTLISLSCTPMPVLRETESVALSLLPLLMEPLACVLYERSKIKQRIMLGKVMKNHTEHLGNIWPITPVDVALKHRHREHVHVVAGQHHLPVFSSLQVNALNLVCPGITPVQQTLLNADMR